MVAENSGLETAIITVSVENGYVILTIGKNGEALRVGMSSHHATSLAENLLEAAVKAGKVN
jgi:hypothetical protein